MQIKHDVKGQLARLLATEDLIVEHRSVDTASFKYRLVYLHYLLGRRQEKKFMTH